MGDILKLFAAPSATFSSAALGLFVLGYFYMFWDRRKEDSELAGDGQVGLKLVLYTFMIVSLGYAVDGLWSVLGFLLSGAKNTGMVKQGLGNLIAGAGLFATFLFVFLPRTNTREFPKMERFAVGTVAVISGIGFIIAVNGLLSGLFTSKGWKTENYANFTSVLVYGALAFFATFRFGAMSGWVAPVRSPQMPAGFAGQPQMQQQQMQQQGGYPQQQGGYPQQQGGYPQQQGGYPQQGGGGLPPPGGSGGGYGGGGGGGWPQQ